MIMFMQSTDFNNVAKQDQRVDVHWKATGAG